MQLTWTELSAPVLIGACVLLLAAAGVYFSFFFRAMQPKRGTLEWIGLVDRPAWLFGCERCSICSEDILPMLLVAVAAAAAYSLSVLLMNGYGVFSSMPPLQTVEAILFALLLPATGAVTMYCLVKRLCGGIFAPILSALLVAFDLDYDPVSMPMFLLALAFFLRWWGVSQKKSVLRCLAELLAVTGFLGVGTYFSPETAWFSAVLFVPLVFAAVFRMLHEDGKYRIVRLIGVIVGFWLLTAAWYTAAHIPAMILASDTPFPQLLAEGKTWSLLLLRGMNTLSRLLPRFSDTIGLGVILIWLYALFSAAGGVYLCVTRHDLRGMLLCWLTVCAAVLWQFSLAPAVLAVVPCAYVWECWREREGGLPAALGAGILLLGSITSYVLLIQML